MPRVRQPWERQEGERFSAYAAFCVYRDLGPDRSLTLAVRAYLTGKAPDKRATKQQSQRRRLATHPRPAKYLRNVRRRWGAWSRRWAWVERVQALDQHLEDLAGQHERERIAELAIQEADARIQARQDELEAGRKAVSVGMAVVQRLQELVKEGELDKLTLERVKASGVQYAVTCSACDFERVLSRRVKLCPNCQSPEIEVEKRYSEVERRSVSQMLAGALRAIGEGQRVQRLVLGEPTDISEQRISEKAREIAGIIRQYVPEQQQEEVAVAIDNLLDGHVAERVAAE